MSLSTLRTSICKPCNITVPVLSFTQHHVIQRRSPPCPFLIMLGQCLDYRPAVRGYFLSQWAVLRNPGQCYHGGERDAKMKSAADRGERATGKGSVRRGVESAAVGTDDTQANDGSGGARAAARHSARLVPPQKFAETQACRQFCAINPSKGSDKDHPAFIP